MLALMSPPGGDLSLGLVPGLILVGLLLIFNGFFVAAEFALVKVRPTQLSPYAERGDRRGRMAKHLVDNLDAYLSACQLGITIASLALGWIGEATFPGLFEPITRGIMALVPNASPELEQTVGILLGFAALTALHIVVGELAPKTLAIRKPEPTSLWVAIPLWTFNWITYPAIWVLNHLSNAFLWVLRIRPVSEEELGHDEEELRRLLGAGGTRLSEAKRRLLDNVFELSHRIARQVMVPRADVVYLSSSQSVEESLEIARKSGHTRFPYCEGDLDHAVGMIHIKDFFRAGEPPASLEEISRKLAMVPETLTLDRLMKRMRAEKLHMAAVLDEYGGVSGIVTLENVIEEIVGEIQDEFDSERPDVVPQGENVYLVAGSILIADLEHQLGIEFSDRDEDTLAGVVLSELGRRPNPGDTVELSPLRLEVVDVQLNRIRTVRVRVTPKIAEE